MQTSWGSLFCLPRHPSCHSTPLCCMWQRVCLLSAGSDQASICGRQGELERLPVGCGSGCGQQGAVEPALSSPAQRQRRSPHFLPGSCAARNPERPCGPRVWRCMPAASLAPDRRHLPLVHDEGFWASKSTRYRASPCGPQLVFSSVAQSCPHSWRPHGLQHTRPPCPSPTPRVYSNSCPLSQ